MLKQPAFFLNIQTCTGCKTCVIACKDKQNLPQGVRWRRVVEFSGGEWTRKKNGAFNQNVFAYYISVSCNHCQDPICVEVCPTKAMNQDDHGIVCVNPDLCVGCRYCEWACPYSAPQFDQTQGRMTKCDFCREELEHGQNPACVAGCPTRALQFGEYDELAAKHGIGMRIPPLPPSEVTTPNFVLEPHRKTTPDQSQNGFISNPEEVRND